MNLQLQRRGNKTHYLLVTDAVRLAPGGHHPGIIAGDEDDLIDALGLEVVEVGKVRGEVLLLACWSECTGDCDDYNLLVLELCMYLRISR